MLDIECEPQVVPVAKSSDSTGSDYRSRVRKTSEDDLKKLKRTLEEIRKTYSPLPTFTNQLITSGFSDDVIEETLCNSYRIFTLTDCQQFLSFLTASQQAKIILAAVEEVFGDTENHISVKDALDATTNFFLPMAEVSDHSDSSSEADAEELFTDSDSDDSCNRTPFENLSCFVGDENESD